MSPGRLPGRGATALAVLLAGACGPLPLGAGAPCREVLRPLALPSELVESSGVAIATRTPGVFWSHNDSGHRAVLHAVDGEGRLLASVPVSNATNRDWEDLEAAPCATGSCLWIADTGDNNEDRDDAVLYRVPEPALDAASVAAEAFPVSFPDGPRDVEALFVLPGEEVFLVSKGRSHDAVLYRYPPPLRAGARVTLEAVQVLFPGPLSIPRQVTGAAAAPGGGAVVVRTYDALYLYRVRDGRLEPLPDGRQGLLTLGEAQGEGVAVGRDGLVVLTGEAGPLGGAGTLAMVRCPALRE